jgi:hypothetical protein
MFRRIAFVLVALAPLAALGGCETPVQPLSTGTYVPRPDRDSRGVEVVALDLERMEVRVTIAGVEELRPVTLVPAEERYVSCLDQPRVVAEEAVIVGGAPLPLSVGDVSDVRISAYCADAGAIRFALGNETDADTFYLDPE